MPIEYGKNFLLRRRRYVLPCTLVVISFARAGGMKCNGHEDFCELPLGLYTFPGTHNSGSFRLSNPSGFADMISGPLSALFAADCFFENHDQNFYQQLGRGVRYFDLDACLKNVTMYNCHSRDGTEPQTGYGEPIETSLATFKEWLRYNPEDIVIWFPNNLHNGITKYALQSLIEKTFGECVPSSQELPVPANVGFAEDALCMKLTNDIANPGNKTLGNLVKYRRRFIYSLFPYQNTYFKTLEDAANTATFLGGLESWARFLPDINANASGFFEEQKQSLALTSIDLFRPLAPDINDVPKCNSASAKEVNEEMLPGEAHDEFDFKPPDGVKCEGMMCKGYRSRLEYIHQVILQRGWALGSVNVDYTKYGELGETIFRINEANVRFFKGLPEPGIYWYEMWWAIMLFVLAGVIPLCIALVCVAEYRPHWYPKCLRKCFCDCEKRKRRLRRKQKEAEEDEIQAEEQKMKRQMEREVKLGLRSPEDLNAYGYPSSQAGSYPPSSGSYPSTQMSPSSGAYSAPYTQQPGSQALAVQQPPLPQQFWPAHSPQAGARPMPPPPQQIPPTCAPRPFQPVWNQVAAPAGGNQLMRSPWQQQQYPQPQPYSGYRQ